MAKAKSKKKQPKYCWSDFKIEATNRIDPDEDDEGCQTYDLVLKIPLKTRSVFGSIVVSDKRNLIEYSTVQPAIRGIGIGYKFYVAVLKITGYLSSEYFDASPEAKRIWRKLSRNYFHQTNFFEGYITVYNDKKSTDNKY